ncbi:polyketide synthase [Poronia punctata]|nr:polyketide synthase [Poronia punctata]
MSMDATTTARQNGHDVSTPLLNGNHGKDAAHLNGKILKPTVNGHHDQKEGYPKENLSTPLVNGNHDSIAAGEEDPICIVGMACRLPGGIRSPSDLWDFLIRKKSAQSPVAAERFNINAFYHPDRSRVNTMDDAYGGYFLQEDVRQFENSFFGINNLEATHMDPQQRKLLEVVYECFESAGLSMDSVAGANIGVYVGIFTVDYQMMQARDVDYLHRYGATGSGTAIMANRISHVFDLHGPSFVLDTACSSSIYCLHNAVNAIRSGECDGAIVAGANLITSPEQHIGTAKSGAVSAVYVKRLSAALRDKDKIWSVIRGTAINANGKTPGITQPSSKLQEAVIRKAYINSKLKFDETDYIECHGTGTAVGDPIEVGGLQNCFGPRDLPLRIGSVYDNLNLERANMRVPVEVEEWPRDLRRASINSFGYGGVNAHAILESIDTELPVPEGQLVVLPVSAMTTKSLETRILQTTQAIQRCCGNDVQSLAYTLTQHRPSLRTRGFLAPTVHHTVGGQSQLPFAFVFTGQGAQYAGMGLELLRNKDFASTIRELDSILQQLPSTTAPAWTLEQTILDPPNISQINDPVRSQPICTAVQIGLVDLLRKWRVSPSATIGHSLGEIGAAYAANLITAKEAILAAYFRGFAVGKLTLRGSMVAAKLTPEAAVEFIEQHGLRGQICVACVNSPESVTLSGTQDGADVVLSELQKSGTFARKLETGGRAYHSHLVKEIGELYESLLTLHLDDSRTSTVRSDIDMFSSVEQEHGKKSGVKLGPNRARTAIYWRNNLERSVQFASALTSLIESGPYHLLEIGPHPALKGPIQQIQKAINARQDLPYSSTLVRNEDADLCLKKMAGILYQFGHRLDWNHVNGLTPQSETEPRPSVELRNRKYARHELLGTLQPAGNGIDWMWRNILQLGEVPWISDHKVESQIVFPAVGYMAMAMEAISQAQGLKDAHTGEYTRQKTTFGFRHVSFGSAFVIEDDSSMTTGKSELHTVLSWRKLSTTSRSAVWCDFSISSWKEGSSVLHCSGGIRAIKSIDPTDTTILHDTNGFETQGMERWYNKLTDEGIVFGPSFQALTSLSTDSARVRTDAVAPTRLRTRVGKDTDTVYPVHPVVIDAVMQAGVMGGTGGNIQVVGHVRDEDAAVIHSRFNRTGVSTIRINSALRDSNGSPLVNIKDLRLSMYTGKMTKQFDDDNLQLQRHPTLRIVWKPDILRLSPDMSRQLESYIDHFLQKQKSESEITDNEILGVMGALLDLIGHNNPKMRVLEIWQSLLGMETALPRSSKVVRRSGDLQDQLLSVLDDDGFVVTRKTDAATAALENANFEIIQVRNGTAGIRSVQHISLLDIPRVTLEREILATIITDVTTNLLWLTDLTLSILDIGSSEDIVRQQHVAIGENILKALMISDHHVDDKEFIQVDGLLYTSRFEPDLGVNELFRRRVGEQDPIKKATLSSVGPCRLEIGRPGVTDTLHFQQVREPSTLVPSGYIDVAIKAVTEQAETRSGTVAQGFTGEVMAVGSDVKNMKPGDRVVVMTPHSFNTIERVPAWTAHRMLPDEGFDALSTIVVTYTTALYALRYRGNLRSGESVLVHLGADPVGMAAITLALSMGAKVFTTVNSQAERDHVRNELGLPDAHIFSSTDSAFVQGLKGATNRRGVDLVINTLAGDLMHASWECLASFSRFVEIGRRKLTDAGRLAMHPFLRNTTFTAFDLMDLFYHEDQYYRDLWTSLTKDVLEMYRSGLIKAGPITEFDITDVSTAFQHVSSKDRLGNVVLSLERSDSQIQFSTVTNRAKTKVTPSKYSTIMDPEKVYLMIGCLGGLGRSLSRWMMARGARYFVFLGRSGCDKPDAKDLVNRLETNGAHVTVVRGDVSNPDHVNSAVEACIATNRPIGGVIQAAMGLHEALFSTMTNEACHTGIQPKWRGTWNLHNALQGHEEALDFFLLTSSVSGSVATATESNYCSANGFLDSFARWRRAQGKKAVSIGFGMIAEVGYLHENPEIGALLLRKGLQALTEDEFLQATDLALSGEGGEYETPLPNPEAARMLTGLEPLGLRKLIEQGWDVSSGNMQDPRTGVLSAALMANQGDDENEADAQVGTSGDPEWLKGVPKNIAASFVAETGAASLLDAIFSITRKRFASLILTPLDQIDASKPLGQFGMDSMIGAELRTWIWGSFKVDIPFLDLLSNQKSLTNIAEDIEAKMGDD